MTEPRRFMLQHKVPSPELDPKIMRRQLETYVDAYRDAPHHRPLPAYIPTGVKLDTIAEAEQALLKHYAQADLAFTMEWWRRFAGEPVLVNKLRGKGNLLMDLNDLIRPSTIEAMTWTSALRCGCGL